MTLEENAQKILNKCRIPSCHSNFQIQNFILGKEYSPSGQIWQCVREIQARVENLQNYAVDKEDKSDDLELALIEVEQIKRERNSKSDDLEVNKNVILVRKCERKIARIKHTLEKLDEQRDNVLKELNVLVNAFNDLVEKYGYKEFEDPEAQSEYWQAKFEKELLVNHFLGLPLNPELIKSCLSLPCDTPLAKQIKIAFDSTQKKLSSQSN
jgi:DNA repair ATPase RecN